MTSRQTWEAAFSTLCSLAGEALLTDVTQFVLSRLRDQQLMAVTLEEYSIYRTPEGTLYDTSVKDRWAHRDGREWAG